MRKERLSISIEQKTKTNYSVNKSLKLTYVSSIFVLKISFLNVLICLNVPMFFFFLHFFLFY